ncbi:MAG: hypothetical protein N2C14_19755, partial [Planctomycetales bacterium]
RVLVSEIGTPIFDQDTAQDCNVVHSAKVEQVVEDWIAFVDNTGEADEDAPFTSLAMERDK